MTRHFQHEIELIKRQILALSALVEERVYMAVRSVLQHDRNLARTVIEGDKEIDAKEVEVEEDCLKVLALHQPVAIDLRFLIAVLKLNNDLERIADLAVSIANRALAIADTDGVTVPPGLREMGEKVKTVLRKSLESLVNLDLDLARGVLSSDDEIDDLNRGLHEALQAAIRAEPKKLEGLLSLISVSRNLERIGDHATNIAEDVIYLVEGEIVRHSKRYAV